MRSVRWVLAFVAALAAHAVGVLVIVLPTRQTAVGPAAGQFWAMFAGCLLAVYLGAMVVERQDRRRAAACLAALSLGVPMFFVFVAIASGRPVSHSLAELLGACFGVAFAWKILPGQKASLGRSGTYSSSAWR